MTSPIDEPATVVLDDYARHYYSGDRTFLFRAVVFCGKHRVPLPDWVWQEMQEAVERYGSGEARDLGEAFGVQRPKGENLAAVRKRHKPDSYGIPLLTRVCIAVEQAAKSAPVDKNLFDSVAAQFPGLSGATVREWWYGARSAHKEK